MIKGSTLESTTSLALEPKSPDFRLGMYRLSPFGFRPLRKSLETRHIVRRHPRHVKSRSTNAKSQASRGSAYFSFWTRFRRPDVVGGAGACCGMVTCWGAQHQWLRRNTVSIGQFPMKAPTLTKHSKSGKLTALSNCFPSTNAAAVPCTDIGYRKDEPRSGSKNRTLSYQLSCRK